ncbi:MAG: TrkH family potassium uptake protein [Eubacterium sp.]|nr:TrkH family potassium uptake protein [Eubacterium sp.]
MNYKAIGFVLAWVLKIEGFLLLLPCLIGLIYQEKQGLIYLAFAAGAIILGWALSFKKPANMSIYRKEGFVTVGLAWIVMSVYGALPFVATGEIPDYIDALFEIISGFTTTGSSILTDVEALSHVSLMWRSFSHWIGGMGVLVFVLMLIPTQKGSHMNLMKAESPGPDVSKFVPRVRDTAKILYKIYFAMTIAQIIILLCSGMYWFDSLCITFGSAGTGGFGILNTSCASYTPFQQWVITIFMIAFGLNFAFYYLLLCRKAKEAFGMEEVRTYLLIILGSIAIITLNTYGTGMYDSFADTLRGAAFQVGSIITTTGYSSVNFDLWPSLSKTILVMLMFIGACAGSTGGGIKVSRVILSFRSVWSELHSIANTRSVKKIRMDGKTISHDVLRSVYAFLTAYFIIFAISFLLVSLSGFDMETNFTAVAATLNNIGPGMAGVGPSANFAGYGILPKLVMCFDMLAGRLEIFPILAVFAPGMWRKN